jgi:cytochrome c
MKLPAPKHPPLSVARTSPSQGRRREQAAKSVRKAFRRASRNQAAQVSALLLKALLLLAPLPAVAQDGDPARGAQVFKACKSCHQVGADARNGVGPHLDGLFGRQAGVIEGFKYSGAMKKLGEEGLVWNDFTLNQYLEKPRAYVPGTRMSYRGMASSRDRTDVIAYLKDLSQADPAEDPSAGKSERAEIGSVAMHLDGDPDYGEYLSSECVTCHQISGRADGIPSIVGWPKEPFIRALFEYKTNVRSHQVMQNMTLNLGNEEIAALAAYFGSLDPQ